MWNLFHTVAKHGKPLPLYKRKYFTSHADGNINGFICKYKIRDAIQVGY